MKKFLAAMLAMALCLVTFGALAQAYEPDRTVKYPAGKLVIYGYGNPQAYEEQFKMWCAMHPEQTEGVEIEVVQCEGAEDVRKKIMLTYQSGAYEDLPDLIATQAATLYAMADTGIVLETTDYMDMLKDELLDGVCGDVTVKGKMYALPVSFRPQMLYYNQKILDEYNIDSTRMDTFDGWIEVGKELRDKSDGKVFLTSISPSQKAWGYVGRRGFWPQAEAHIFDENGNVVWGEDAGVRQAMETLNTLLDEKLVLLTQVLQPPMWDATRNHEIATFYVGAFWDEFLAKNVPEESGEWRLMPAPTYDNGLRGAPVTEMFAIINKQGETKYEQLIKDCWYDYMFTAEFRNAYADLMAEKQMPCWNPLSKELSADAYWQQPAEYYGGQSFKGAETEGLVNSAPNMVITGSDVEADQIIRDGIDRMIAGDWNMEETIQNIDAELKAKIGKAQ